MCSRACVYMYDQVHFWFESMCIIQKKIIQKKSAFWVRKYVYTYMQYSHMHISTHLCRNYAHVCVSVYLNIGPLHVAYVYAYTLI
jgi:hypothetical protein